MVFEMNNSNSLQFTPIHSNSLQFTPILFVFFSVFLFDSFAPAHLALRANLRLLYRAPAPALGCVHPSHPWSLVSGLESNGIKL